MEMFLIYLLCFATQETPNVRYSHVHLPAHGTIQKGTLYGFFGKKDDDFGLDAIPIQNPSGLRTKVYDFRVAPFIPDGNSFRHQIQFKSIWVSRGHTSLSRVKLADLQLYDIKNTTHEFQFYSRPNLIFPDTLHDKYRRIAENQLGINWYGIGYPTDVLGYGSVPTSETSIKSYILPKRTKQIEIWDSQFLWDEKTKGWKTKPAARFEKMGQWIADLDSSNSQKRTRALNELEKLGELAEPALKKLLDDKSSLETRRRVQMLLEKLSSGESKAEKLMEDADNYEKFPSLFLEDFYFFLRQNDYYFVTQSGKLYIAPSPKPGTPRAMKALWTDAKRPIVAVIEDADRDRVWLFAKDKNAGAKLDFFFEMKETIQAETFDPAKLRRVNVEGRARRLLEYWPLVSAEKSPNKQ